MATVPITLAVSSGGITVTPSSASANRGDLIRWTLTGADNLTISFPNKTPFDLQQLTVAGDQIERGILANAGTTGYGYVVAAVVNGQQYVGPPPMEPEIIVM